MLRHALLTISLAALLWCTPIGMAIGGSAPVEEQKAASAMDSAPFSSGTFAFSEDRRLARRLRNIGATTLIALAALWVFFRVRRQIQRIRSRGDRIAPGAVLSRLGTRALAAVDSLNRLPQIRNKALLAALACLAAAGGGVSLAWFKAMRLSPLLEVPWRYALVSAGLSVTALLLIACAIIDSNRVTKLGERVAGATVEVSRSAPWILSAASIMILATFQWLDLWNSSFSEHSWHYSLYGLMRLLFMPFLAATLIGTGNAILTLLEHRWGNFLGGQIERAVAAFLIGTAAWYVISFPANLAGLLHYYLIAPLFVLGIWLSTPTLLECGRHSCRWLSDRLYKATLVRLLSVSMPLAVVLVSWTQLLIDRGLAITGLEYDSYGHYIPYYQTVVERGATGINELWYHFWISKGAALHLVATLLTDIHGSQLVSFTLLTATLCLTTLLVYRISGSATIGLCAGALFVAPFTHGFPYYQKHHIVTVALIGGILWLVARGWLRGGGSAAAYSAMISMLALAAVFNAPPISAVICPFLLLTAFAGRFLGNAPSRSIWILVAPAAVAGAGIAGLLILNYVTTGLMEVTPFRFFWNLANQSSFSTLISPYLLLFAAEGTSPAIGKAAFGEALDLIWLRNLLHIQFLPHHLFFVAGGLSVVIIIGFFFDRRAGRPFLAIFVPAATLVASAAALALIIRQPGSIERFYLFNLLPVVLLVASAPAALYRHLYSWNIEHVVLRRIRSAGALILVLMMVAFSIQSGATWINGHFFHETTRPFISKLRFAVGQSSFNDTLLTSHKPRDPARWPRREISEECLGIMEALRQPASSKSRTGAAPQVWTITFLQEAGCHVLPGVRFMMEFSNRFGERWHRIVFGAPDVAERELERIGVRHVYVNLADLNVDNKTGFSTAIFGCLAYSPLFDPAQLTSRFRIAWNRDDAYLLVLASTGQGTALPESFTARFSAKRSTPQPGLGDMGGICARLADYYHKFGENWPVQVEPSLPPLQGWQ